MCASRMTACPLSSKNQVLGAISLNPWAAPRHRDPSLLIPTTRDCAATFSPHFTSAPLPFASATLLHIKFLTLPNLYLITLVDSQYILNTNGQSVRQAVQGQLRWPGSDPGFCSSTSYQGIDTEQCRTETHRWRTSKNIRGEQCRK